MADGTGVSMLTALAVAHRLAPDKWLGGALDR